MNFIGIDPGVSGAVAWLRPGHAPRAFKIPVQKLGPSNVVDGRKLHMLLMDPDSEPEQIVVTIERVHAMPKQGVSSTFTFGAAFGAALALAEATATRVHILRPDQWRPMVGLNKSSTKDEALAMVSRMWADLDIGKNHNMAEALLLAEAGRRIGL